MELLYEESQSDKRVGMGCRDTSTKGVGWVQRAPHKCGRFHLDFVRISQSIFQGGELGWVQ